MSFARCVSVDHVNESVFGASALYFTLLPVLLFLVYSFLLGIHLEVFILCLEVFILRLCLYKFRIVCPLLIVSWRGICIQAASQEQRMTLY